MKIVREITCPNCKKRLIEVQLRRGYVRNKKRINKDKRTMLSDLITPVKGIYEWRVKEKKCN